MPRAKEGGARARDLTDLAAGAAFQSTPAQQQPNLARCPAAGTVPSPLPPSLHLLPVANVLVLTCLSAASRSVDNSKENTRSGLLPRVPDSSLSCWLFLFITLSGAIISCAGGRFLGGSHMVLPPPGGRSACPEEERRISAPDFQIWKLLFVLADLNMYGDCTYVCRQGKISTYCC